MDARLEIPVAGKYGARDKVVLEDCFLDCGIKRAGVAHAGGATIGDHVITETLEIRKQAGIAQVRRHDLGSGGERCLDPGIDRESFLNGLFGQQTGREQQIRIGRVGA